MTTRRRTWVVTTTALFVLLMVLMTLSEAFVVVKVPYSSSTAEITTTSNRSRRRRRRTTINNIIENKSLVSATSSTPPLSSTTSALSLSPSSSLFTEFANGYNDWLDSYPLLTQAITASVLAGVGDITAQLRQRDEGSLDLERLKRFTIKGLGGGIIWSFWYTIADTWTDQFMIQGEGVLQQLQEAQESSGGGGTLNLMTMLLSTMAGASSSSSNVGDSTIVAKVMESSIDIFETAPILSSPPDMMMDPQQFAGSTVDPTSVTIITDNNSNNVIGRTIISILLEQFFWCPIVYSLWDIPVPTLLSASQDNRSIPTQIKTKLPGLLVDNAKVWTFANWIVYSAPLQYRVLVSSIADIVWQSIVSGHVMMEEEEKDSEVDQQLILSSILGNEDETTTTGASTPATSAATDATAAMATERV